MCFAGEQQFALEMLLPRVTLLLLQRGCSSFQSKPAVRTAQDSTRSLLDRDSKLEHPVPEELFEHLFQRHAEAHVRVRFAGYLVVV